jgi:hypothetical protein
MPNEDFLNDLRTGLQESIKYFNVENKSEREIWICKEFLRNFGTHFRQYEVVASSDEPPDVIFRSAKFEIKEILDPGRKRHKEYKLDFEKALAAKSADELLKDFSPKDISIQEVLDKVNKLLNKTNLHYPQALRRSLDLLVYVNLLEHRLGSGDMSCADDLPAHGWRSISILFGWHSIVFDAKIDAPKSLKIRVRTVNLRGRI